MIIELANNLIALALDAQGMPDVGENVHVRAKEIAAQAIHHFVEANVVPQRAGAKHVKI